MDTLEYIELFYTEMLNEISNLTLDESDKALLLNSLKDVNKLVLDTYNANK